MSELSDALTELTRYTRCFCDQDQHEFKAPCNYRPSVLVVVTALRRLTTRCAELDARYPGLGPGLTTDQVRELLHGSATTTPDR